jgi:hypothetical protein
MPTAERDANIQQAANNLAKQWRKEGKKSFSKEGIANTLAKSPDGRHMTSERIKRIIRKQW